MAKTPGYHAAPRKKIETEQIIGNPNAGLSLTNEGNLPSRES